MTDRAIEVSRASAVRAWVDRRFLGVGAGSGLLGGICCVGGAVATGLGVSALAFFGVWMDRYQGYVVAGSAAVMLLWLARVAKPYGFSGPGLRQAARVLGRHALVMGVIYGVTLAVTMGVARLLAAPR
jgi:hypothetical protein